MRAMILEDNLFKDIAASFESGRKTETIVGLLEGK